MYVDQLCLAQHGDKGGAGHGGRAGAAARQGAQEARPLQRHERGGGVAPHAARPPRREPRHHHCEYDQRFTSLTYLE